MISYNVIDVNGKYDKLLEESPTGEPYIDKDYIDNTVIERFDECLGNKISKIIVEWPYYDHDYLSTYYMHYSKKFRNFSKYCYRLHFITYDDKYCGCTILRPVMYGKRLGRTYLDPSLFVKDEAYIMRATYKVHLNGVEYKISAFPWMMQDTDITICAHISVWTILRYFGSKYTNYLNPPVGDIVENVNEIWGRKTPSIGLTPIQVADVIGKYGFYPIIRGGDKKNIINLLDEAMAYIESGIPIIAMSESRQHAFSIIGHGKINKNYLSDKNWINKSKEPGIDSTIILHSRLFSSIYIMDDNYFPYQQIGKIAREDRNIEYSMTEISYVVIPLYSRMQLEYHEVYNRFIGLVKYGDMNWSGNRVIRIYITTSNSLKKYYKNLKDVSPVLKKIILQLNMPKFVWCIDSSTDSEYMETDIKISGKVIIDATAGTKDVEPWLLLHDNQKIKYYDVSVNEKKVVQNIEILPYMGYVHNLDVVKPDCMNEIID